LTLLYRNNHLQGQLKKPSQRKYDVIVGNPPWGRRLFPEGKKAF
jgi:23S rRNA G2445 N2-methylase RlmL